jgi:hypothetical protein
MHNSFAVPLTNTVGQVARDTLWFSKNSASGSGWRMTSIFLTTVFLTTVLTGRQGVPQVRGAC